MLKILTLRDGLLKFSVIFAVLAGGFPEAASLTGVIGDGRLFSFSAAFSLVSTLSSELSSSKASLLGAGVKLWVTPLPSFLDKFDFSVLIEETGESLFLEANWVNEEGVSAFFLWKKPVIDF